MKYLLILLALALTSCGGGGGSSAPPATSGTSDSATIEAFSATTNPATTPTTIDPYAAINPGKFSLSWTIKDATVPNAIAMSFSTSSTYNSKDPTVFPALCIPAPGTACGVKTYTTSCSFDTNNIMKCPALKSAGVDLTQYISDAGGIPSTGLPGYLILHACNPISYFCTSQAVPVILK